MSDKYKFMLAEDLFSLCDRESATSRVFLQAIEALRFSHPYKKFYYRVYAEYIRNSKLTVDSVDVMDYGAKVCRIMTYSPEGTERNKYQAQFEYDYDVHQKEPKNVKRSSDYKKIVECAKLVRPFDYDRDGAMSDVFIGIGDSLANVTKLREGQKKVDKLFSNLHYGGHNEKLALYNLICGNMNPETEKMKTEFINAYNGYHDSMNHYNALMNRIAMVFPTVHGEYRVVRRQYKGRGDRESHFMNYDYETKIYPNKDSLPEDLTGKMAVLEILPSEGSVSEIDDVGIFNANDWKYTIIGEDLNGIDAREEGQVSSI
jgi:hypothetical protein